MVTYTRLLLILLLVIPVYTLRACDVCGCSVNASYMGILPQFQKHFVGVRYMTNNFRSQHIPSQFVFEGGQSEELFQRAEIWGRYYVTPKIQVFGFLPYSINRKTENRITSQFHGLADASVMVNYIFLNTGDSGRFSVRNTIMAGGGLKLPTGRFNKDELPNMQTGTGSWDYMLNLIYTLRYKKTGVNVDLNGRINNSNGTYTFGNRLTSGARFFYWHKYKMVSFLPQIGGLAEFAQKDTKEGVLQKYSGGHGFYGIAGADIYFRTFSAGFSLTLPVKENLNERLVATRQRLSFQLIYLFN